MPKNANTILLFLILLSVSLFAQDPREKNHSMSIIPFIDGETQKYYVTWSSSSGSNDGWQHDIYNQIISFTIDGNINYVTDAQRFIGTGYDEAQEPVNVAIDPSDNTMLSVWEDGSGSSVDIRGQMHKPDGTIIKNNWIIAGGAESQHSPDVVHLSRLFIVSLTDEAPPAQTSMNEVRMLNDKTGEEIGLMELSPRDEDHWWAVATSNDSNFTFIGWGDGENFYGSVIKTVSDTIIKTDQQFYISNIEQYYYNIIWLENLHKFMVIAKVNGNSVVCLIDTNGVRNSLTTIPDAPITRETDLAVRWDEVENEYLIIYTSGQQDLTLLSASANVISLVQINERIIIETSWPTTGISCQFVQSNEGSDLWNSDRKLLIVHNDENSNNAIYHYITVEDLTDINNGRDGQYPDEFMLYPAYPNPFNPSVIISFSIPNNEEIQVKIYNLKGELLTTIVNSSMPKGNNSVEWSGYDKNNNKISSGVYIVQVIAGEFVQSQKIIFQK